MDVSIIYQAVSAITRRDESTGVSPRDFLTAGIIMLSFTALFVATRIAANLRRGQMLVSDVITILSLLLLAAFVGLSYYMNEYMFVDPATPIHRELVFSQLSFWVAAAAMWCSKAPILFLLINLFGVHHWLRNVCYVTLVALGVAVVTGTAVSSGTCDLRGRTPSISFLLQCSDTSSTVGVGLGIISAVADLVIMVIPIPVIFNLRMPTHKKVGLVVIFTSGIFALTASIVSVYYKWQSKNGSTTSVTATMVCTMVESCIATIVGCIPATHQFWSQIVPASSLYLHLASILSTQNSAFRSKLSGQSGADAGFSEHIKRGDSGLNTNSTERLHNQVGSNLPPNAVYKSVQYGFHNAEIPLNQFH